MLDILHVLGSFILAISILVGIHEYGHYWMAKRMGVKVLCFSIGFGRQLLSWKRGGTQFKIGLFPLGGYVKMLDEREGPVPVEERHLAFNYQPVWSRTAIVAAGPLANFLFAILAYTAVFMLGITGFPAVLGSVLPGSIAARAGMYENLEIVEMDKKPISTWEDVVVGTLNRVGDNGTIEIKAREKLKGTNIVSPSLSSSSSISSHGSDSLQHAPDTHLSSPHSTDSNTSSDHTVALLDADIKTYKLDISHWQPKDAENPVSLLGLQLNLPPIPAIVGELQLGEEAEAAGIHHGDKILVVDGHKIGHWEDFLRAIRDNPERSLHITLERDGQTLGVDVTPKRVKDAGQGHGFIGLSVLRSAIPPESLKFTRYGPIDAFNNALKKTWNYSVSTLKMIKKMVVGDLSPKQLSGPITIARYASDSFISGLSHFIGFLALVSISLGVMNLLPIPVLDGGHLLYYLIEVLRGGRQLSEKHQQLGLQIGTALLLLLMCLAFYNDVLRMF